ncbi:MAG TPA: M56 family metallopeptidase, partial [Bryobacteraceae bacterium]|nr:M56 family metallopeptidase [Bryobacteraceae bacterium]
MQRLALEFALRAGLIAVAAGAVLAVWRIRAAAAQHAVWTGVVAAMLLLPFWIAWGPKARLPVLPPPGAQAVIPEAGPVMDATPAAPVRPHSAPQAPTWNWSALGIGVYLLGVGALLLRLAIGMIGASRLTPASCVAPVTVGVLHPRIILPQCWREWPQAQLDAVLAHERAHARRRDPLVQWLALLNRALFWFHPLAWWLERRLAALAEEACDAAVIGQGHDPRQYSGYLLDLARAVERAGMRVNATAVAMPGSYLPQRVRKLLAGRMPSRVSPTRMVCAGVACTLASALFAAGSLDRLPPVQLPPLLLPAAHPPGPEAIPARRLLAQAAVPQAPVQGAPAVAPSPRFEVASVKPATPLGPRGMQGDAGGGPGTNDPGTWHCHNCPVFWVLSGAYDVALYEYIGPGWVHQVRFDFDAKVP